MKRNNNSYSNYDQNNDNEDDNDNDSSDNNDDQAKNVQITLNRGWITLHEIYYENRFLKMFKIFLTSYSFLLEGSNKTILGQSFGLRWKKFGGNI